MATRNGRQSRERDIDTDRDTDRETDRGNGSGKKQFDSAYNETRRYGSEDSSRNDTKYTSQDRDDERNFRPTYGARDDQDAGSYDRQQNQSDWRSSDWGRNDRYGRDDERDFNPGARYRMGGNNDQRGYSERNYNQAYDDYYGRGRGNRNPMDRNRPGVNFDAEFGNYPRSDRYDENVEYPYTGMGRGQPYGEGYSRNQNWGPQRGQQNQNWGRDQGSREGGFGQYSRAGTQQDRSQQRGGQRFDRDYLSWRDEQMRKLDDDYDAYRKENQSRFNEEFDTWRTKRASTKSKGSEKSETSRSKA